MREGWERKRRKRKHGKKSPRTAAEETPLSNCDELILICALSNVFVDHLMWSEVPERAGKATYYEAGIITMWRKEQYRSMKSTSRNHDSKNLRGFLQFLWWNYCSEWAMTRKQNLHFSPAYTSNNIIKRCIDLASNYCHSNSHLAKDTNFTPMYDWNARRPCVNRGVWCCVLLWRMTACLSRQQVFLWVSAVGQNRAFETFNMNSGRNSWSLKHWDPRQITLLEGLGAIRQRCSLLRIQSSQLWNAYCYGSTQHVLMQKRACPFYFRRWRNTVQNIQEMDRPREIGLQQQTPFPRKSSFICC